MSDPVESLILDLLEWIGPAGRPYAEVIDAWRTSCPRLPVWEEANARQRSGRGRCIADKPTLTLEPAQGVLGGGSAQSNTMPGYRASDPRCWSSPWPARRLTGDGLWGSLAYTRHVGLPGLARAPRGAADEARASRRLPPTATSGSRFDPPGAPGFARREAPGCIAAERAASLDPDRLVRNWARNAGPR